MQNFDDFLHTIVFNNSWRCITLDANVVLDQKNDPLDLIKKYTQIIGEEFLWELIITDIYQDPKTNKYRYTFQASYFNLDDKTAKNIHLKAFNLK